MAQHELMDSPGKLENLLVDAGFRNPTAEALDWSDHPTLDEFIDRHSALSRRLALLDEQTREAVLIDVRQRLQSLTHDDFLDASDVVMATASAPQLGPQPSRVTPSHWSRP